SNAAPHAQLTKKVSLYGVIFLALGCSLVRVCDPKIMKFKSLVVVLSVLAFDLLAFPHSFAQTPSQSPSPSPVALKAGRLLDVRTGKVTSDVYVTIENHRIKSIGATPPQGVQIIDLSNSLVMPGMVDCHAHILGNLGDLTPGAGFRM